jgi:hypothetical protein
MVLVYDIFLNGLGASPGGAIAGGFFGSFLQVYLSSKNDQEKDHLSDLKKDVINPLINTVSSFNFTLADFTFEGFRYEGGVGIQSNDVPFEDFMSNHYPDIRSKLNESVRLSLDMSNKKHNLVNKLRANLSSAFNDLNYVEFQKVNTKAIDTLVEAILSGYDSSFLRMTDYLDTRILYFYPVENPLIAFSEEDKYLIFRSALTNAETNVTSVNDIRSTLIEAIENITNRLANELQGYNASKGAFTNERNDLLDTLLERRYGTKLNFEKKKWRKKCSLV